MIGRYKPTIFAAVLIVCAMLFAGGCAKKPSPDDETRPKAGAAKKGKQKNQPELPDTKAEEELLQEAVEAYDQGLYTLAKDTFSELRDKYPGSYYSAFAELKTADAQFQISEFPAAVVAYEEFLRLHPQHEAAAYAKYQIGNSQRLQYRGVKHDQAPLRAAIKSYEKLLLENPASRYAPLARRYIKQCRERLAAHEAYVAEFYLKQGQAEASAKRYAVLAGNYRGSEAAVEAETKLGRAEELQPYLKANKRTHRDAGGSIEQAAATLTDLRCEQRQQKSLFSLLFASEVELSKARPAPDEEQDETRQVYIAFASPIAPGKHKVAVSAKEFRCEAGGSLVEAKEVAPKKAGQPPIVRIKIELPAAKKLNFVTLEPRSKIIAVVE